jgi:hypothetical protein
MLFPDFLSYLHDSLLTLERESMAVGVDEDEQFVSVF